MTGVILIVVITLLRFVPAIGVVGLVVATPIIGCILMCGVMIFFMKKENDHKN